MKQDFRVSLITVKNERGELYGKREVSSFYRDFVPYFSNPAGKIRKVKRGVFSVFCMIPFYDTVFKVKDIENNIENLIRER